MNQPVVCSPAGPLVLASRPSSNPRLQWQARISPDRGRLEVVAVVELGSNFRAAHDSGADTFVVPILSDAELRALLAAVPSEPEAALWICAECGRANSLARSWCETCAQHQTGGGSE